jgi:hypothetical protein
MSPQTKVKANAAAAQASRFPIERKLARLTTVSSESLASAAEFHRARSPVSPDRAATTVPAPKTRSLMPIVLMSNSEAPVGRSPPARRIGAPGAAIRATPTKDRSHPIVSSLVIGIVAAYPRPRSVGPANRGWGGQSLEVFSPATRDGMSRGPIHWAKALTSASVSGAAASGSPKW